MDVVVVVGNPKLESRTAATARDLATGLSGHHGLTIELAEVGARLLDWGDPEVDTLVRTVAAADVAIFASPTFKASFSGLLKLFLDRFAGGTGLEDVVAVPLMVAADPRHALAAEVHLKPVLVQLGATCPTPAVFVPQAQAGTSGATHDWVARWRSVVVANLRR